MCSKDTAWRSIWSGTAGNSADRAVKFDPPVCPYGYKTDIVRLDLDTKAAAGWNNYDAVSLHGSLEFPPGLILPDSRAAPGEENKVTYLPLDGVHGVDRFEFTTTDCLAYGAPTEVTITLPAPSGAQQVAAAPPFLSASATVSANIDEVEGIYVTSVPLELDTAPMAGTLSLYRLLDEAQPLQCQLAATSGDISSVTLPGGAQLGPNQLVVTMAKADWRPSQQWVARGGVGTADVWLSNGNGLTYRVRLSVEQQVCEPGFVLQVTSSGTGCTPCPIGMGYDYQQKRCVEYGSILVTLAQVLPDDASCEPHAAGLKLAVDLINGLNDGSGFNVGTDGQTVRFELKQVYNGARLSAADYEQRHHAAVSRLIDEGVELFGGSCSTAAFNESRTINAAGRILLAQNGDDKLYRDASGQPAFPYLFGIHLASSRYEMATIDMVSSKGAATAVFVGRAQPASLAKTCSSGAEYARQLGMQVLLHILYEVDTVDPAGRSHHVSIAHNVSKLNPDLVVGCMGSEDADFYVDAWHNSRWAPKAAFFTHVMEDEHDASGRYSYATSAGQWARVESYSDDLVGSIELFQATYASRFNHELTGDSVASYMIPFTLMKAIQATFAGDVAVSPSFLLPTSGTYDRLRIGLSTIFLEQTVFGRVQFDRYRRNVGREAMQVQYQTVEGTTNTFSRFVILPFGVAQRSIVYPSPSTWDCVGTTVKSWHRSQACWLCSKCMPAAVLRLGYLCARAQGLPDACVMSPLQ